MDANEHPLDDNPSEDNLEQVEMDMEESDHESEYLKNECSNPHSDGLRRSESDKDYIHDNHNDRYPNSKFRTNIIQITNICPAVTLEQMSTMFGMLGNIANISLYHYNNNQEYNFKVCFVEYLKHISVLLAQHLTNVVFIDRALIVLPYNKPEIPDENTAFAEGPLEYITLFNPGVFSQVTTSTGGAQMIATADSKLTATGLSSYPHLPLNTEPSRVEEIRRTLYIGNLDSTVPPDQVMKFFNDLGEVKFIRIAGDETQPTRFAFVEYTHQTSVMNALQQNGSVLGSRPLKINHSNNSIVKPQPRIEVDISMKRARDRSASREYSSRDRGYQSSRRDRDRSRYRDASRTSRSRRSRSRDNGSRSRRSRSRDYPSRKSPSREHGSSSRRRRRSRESSKRYRSRSRSNERRSRRNKSRR